MQKVYSGKESALESKDVSENKIYVDVNINCNSLFLSNVSML